MRIDPGGAPVDGGGWPQVRPGQGARSAIRDYYELRFSLSSRWMTAEQWGIIAARERREPWMKIVRDSGDILSDENAGTAGLYAQQFRASDPSSRSALFSQ
jgi:hypothetical protein